MAMLIPGLQPSQSAPQKKQESTLRRTRELYVLVALLAEIKDMVTERSHKNQRSDRWLRVVLTWFIVIVNVHHSVLHTGHFVGSD